MNTRWHVVETTSLTKDYIEELLENRLAAIRVPDFISPQACARIRATLRTAEFEFYENVDPPIGRIGITQFEHGIDTEGYFAQSGPSNVRRRQLFVDAEDPVERVRFELTSAWGQCVDVAEGTLGQPYFAGLVRYISEALLHLDWAPLDAPGWSINSIDSQIAWNVYIAVPDEGGNLVVNNRPWTLDAENFRTPENYSYRTAVLDGCEQVVITPRVGELVLFNSRNMHAVTAGRSQGERISVSSFVGRMPDGRLVMWS